MGATCSVMTRCSCFVCFILSLSLYSLSATFIGVASFLGKGRRPCSSAKLVLKKIVPPKLYFSTFVPVTFISVNFFLWRYSFQVAEVVVVRKECVFDVPGTWLCMFLEFFDLFRLFSRNLIEGESQPLWAFFKGCGMKRVYLHQSVATSGTSINFCSIVLLCCLEKKISRHWPKYGSCFGKCIHQREIFQHNRLHFGINSASEIFHPQISHLIQGI